jgi:hypothetical protein
MLGLQSHPFFRRYGTILPTSLTYVVLFPETFHLGDPMRLSVQCERAAFNSLSAFHGTKFTPHTVRNNVPGFTEYVPHLAARAFRGTVPA